MLPIGTDYRLRKTPWANYAIVAANVLIFVMGDNGASSRGDDRIYGWMLQPDAPQLFQFFSSVFLHAGWMHLLGNMLFLWVFGNAINDRLGHAGYLAFYLAGGVLACIGYLLLGGHGPVLGASGAISAVTGAYLVLLPRVRVTVLLFVFFVMPIEISSLYFLAFQFVFNLWMSYGEIAGPTGGGVAYAAHSSGYVFGAAVAAGLLGGRLLPRDPYDLLNLIRAHGRRSKYRRMVVQGFDPFNNIGPSIRGDSSRHVASRAVGSAVPDGLAAQDLELRRSITEFVAHGDLNGAAEMYLRLVQISQDAVLPRQQQLDVANQLMASQRYPAAADAYERFRAHYGNYENMADICLMLGLLYGRYLHQYDRAEENLGKALAALTDQRKRSLAQAELVELVRRKGG